MIVSWYYRCRYRSSSKEPVKIRQILDYDCVKSSVRWLVDRGVVDELMNRPPIYLETKWRKIFFLLRY